MKSKDIEYKNLSKEELEAKLVDLRKNLMELSFKKKTSHVEKPHLFKKTKKDIARILTILREKQNERG